MTFTYIGDGSTTLDLIRLAIADTVTANAIFTDEEISGQVGQWGTDINSVAGHLMNAIAASAARIAIVCTIGSRDFVTDRKAVAKECREQAKAFFEAAGNVPYATEVALEDEDLTYVDAFTDPNISQEIGLDDLNT